MTDYTRSTGSSGTMMIRDHNPGGASGTVEFWLNSNNGTTFNHELPWNWIINGGSGSAEHNYNAGSGWNLLGSWTVSSSQTVRFGIGNTGTSGFGGPTNFDQFIQRATVPAAPNAPTFSSVQPQTLTASWTDNSNGGAAIDDHQVAYGLTAGSETTIVSSGTATTKAITGLTPGTTYFFKVRAHNSVGWGAWSGNSSIMTIAGVRIKDGGVWKIAVPYVKDGGVWKLARPYVKVAGVWKETI